MKIRPVFHVNLLKPAGRTHFVEPSSNHITSRTHPKLLVPHSVLKVNPPDESPRNCWEWLVRWVNTEADEDTWQDVMYFEDSIELLLEFYQSKIAHYQDCHDHGASSTKRWCDEEEQARIISRMNYQDPWASAQKGARPSNQPQSQPISAGTTATQPQLQHPSQD
ncbi:hypothetical protein SeLEV6574_g07075 [Synchytrium endobioticum]|uniref:Chromo domain-containing protein n=1 Tax=Synchytrium endobioticum TaxID=286115 RepID=A0A507CEZ2_9FUNG|nr:hypothetical protein SeLEV6574_g07075 [Synchytrium endobioticum]